MARVQDRHDEISVACWSRVGLEIGHFIRPNRQLQRCTSVRVGTTSTATLAWLHPDPCNKVQHLTGQRCNKMERRAGPFEPQTRNNELPCLLLPAGTPVALFGRETALARSHPPRSEPPADGDPFAHGATGRRRKPTSMLLLFASISTQFTPTSSLLGGVLIGLSATIMLLTVGRVTGISGILDGLVDRNAPGDERSFRFLFVVGLLLGALPFSIQAPHLFDLSPTSSWKVILAGLLVGFGTRLGGGCTSGHGVCGLSRLSLRSLAATSMFIATGVVTVTLIKWLEGGG